MDLDSINEPLLPSGFAEFLIDKSMLHYEDSYVVADRNPDGSLSISGRFLRPVFIYRSRNE